MAIRREFRDYVTKLTKGLREREIAERTGISQPYINQMLKGRVPSQGKLWQLAKGLAPSDPADPDDAGPVGTLFRELLIAAGYREVDRDADFWELVADAAGGPGSLSGVLHLIQHRRWGGLDTLDPGEWWDLLHETTERISEGRRPLRQGSKRSVAREHGRLRPRSPRRPP